MTSLPATIEPQEVQGQALTTEQSVEFKLKAWATQAKELQAFIAGGVPTIAGIGDKVGYAKVSEWRKKAMRARTGLDSHRKELTAEARRYQDLVNSKAKEIAASIEAVEDALFAEEDRIDKLIEADKAAKQREIDERVRRRTEALNAVRATFDFTQIAGMPEDNFQSILAAATVIYEAEEKRKAEAEAELARLQAEEADRQRKEAEAKAEAQRIEREALEAQRKAQAEAQAKIDAQLAEIAAEKKRIADAEATRLAQEAAKKAEVERVERERVIAEQAAQKAKEALEAKLKADKEKADREAKEAEERRAAIEAARPDAEKLAGWIEAVQAIDCPEMATKAGKEAAETFTAALTLALLRGDELVQNLKGTP